MLEPRELSNVLSAVAVEVAQEKPTHLRKSEVDRAKLIGASEIGICARLTTYRKLNGETAPDTVTAGHFLRGRALEAVGVKLLRAAAPTFGFDVYSTGHRQVELARGPFVAHPDAVLVKGDMRVPVDFKTARNLKADIPAYQRDQAIVQAGLLAYHAGGDEDLLDVPFGLLIRLDAGAPSLNDVQAIPFDWSYYQLLEERAKTILAFVELGSYAGVQGEPDRAPGGCRNCPIREDCPAFRTVLAEAKEGGFESLDVGLQVDLEMALNELAPLEAQVEAPNKRIAELRDEIKAMLAPTGLRKFTYAGAAISLSEGTRETFDSKAFKTHNPEAFAQFSKTTPTTTLRIAFKED